MQRKKQDKLTALGDKTFTAWGTAIQDTESAIDRARRRLKDLKSALRVFKERQASGEPFPGQAKPKRRAKAA
jgi:hypothetical protein